ncbi:4Fe-4S dicluster domain-containing protein [Campylobacter geochelonis]|uniref:Ubiquinol cytochrome C oxidoreductase, cytochrome b subunit n=1 Tax=Campylobacter geochelonis TaxID=1780362 RepID=A0A128EHR5_9BACT|nr:4Fe-4S dicluster domain-containing protein [Campylobacter geochelonis]QKF71397.1 molybdopterin-dependent oxidoreductase, iron-sulfur subunit [Campylobacter geochelonis]CZE48425.1 ubiquinol cytochrome C oxidoreductase%2C cytochrome b subunit [Campylobacter geochelonis]
MSKFQKGFLFDQNFCIGCKACEIACQVYHQQDEFINWRVVDTFIVNEDGMEKELFLSHSCHHCEEPECMRVCPSEAISKRKDGIVEINRDKCIGCGYCEQSCSYGAITLMGKDKKAQKCNLCAERLDEGELPACVAGCPCDTLKLVDIFVADSAKMQKDCVGFKDLGFKPSIRFYPKFRAQYYDKKVKL